MAKGNGKSGSNQSKSLMQARSFLNPASGLGPTNKPTNKYKKTKGGQALALIPGVAHYSSTRDSDPSKLKGQGSMLLSYLSGVQGVVVTILSKSSKVEHMYC